MPDLVVGDLDSISREGESFLLDSSIELVRVPSMKDFTDIQLALGTAAGRGAANVGLTGVSAGRIDHELGVLGACAGMGKLAPTIIEDDRRVAFLDAEGRAGLHLHELGASVGDEFSVIALSEDARVSESGVRYPLDEGRLSILDPRGVSNVVAEDDSAVSVSSGRVAVVFMPAHARG
jgi:thiamine pyrophosphokinase